jgi:undecaprenyl diphosphate synthase
MSQGSVPRHIAVIMDGNGRWAAKRALPRPAGHHMGVKSVKATVENCARRGVEVLTLFAFSSENWKRPREEVSMLMGRFLEALDTEVDELHKNQIRIRFIGNLEQLSTALRERIANAEALTRTNTRMTQPVSSRDDASLASCAPNRSTRTAWARSSRSAMCRIRIC